MKSKFCMLTTTNYRQDSKRHIGVLLPLVIMTVMQALSGDLTAQSPSPSPAKKPMGYLRFWNLVINKGTALDLVVGNPSPQDPAFLVASPMNFYGNYRLMPPGTYPIKIYKTGDHNIAVKEFNLAMRDGMCITILAQEKDGRISVEANDDTFDPDKTESGRLIVRDYYPDAKVVITADGAAKTDPMSAGDVSQLDSLPLRSVSLAMTAISPNGQTSQWTTAINFNASRRATLLVMPDSYGRFRPRVAIDGQPPKIEDDAQNNANTKPHR